MANPLRQAWRQAQRVDRKLAQLFGSYLGSAQHPRGQVLTAFRTAWTGIERAYKLPQIQRQRAIADVLITLRLALEAIVRRAISEAAAVGLQSAAGQVSAYQGAGLELRPVAHIADTETLVTGWLATVSAQVDKAQALAAANMEAEMVRASLIPATVNRDGSQWIAAASALAFRSYLTGAGDMPAPDLPDFQRQAIAAIDGRTTDCCLAVTGQVVNINEPFQLTADPRPWGDRLLDPPFHWNCRTSVVLYRPEYDDGMTEELRGLAEQERDRRRVLQEQIRDVKYKLLELKRPPDARFLKDDPVEVRKLRRELKRLRRRLGDYG